MRRFLLPLLLLFSVTFMSGCVLEPFLPWNWTLLQWIAFVLLIVVIVGYVIYRKRQV